MYKGKTDVSKVALEEYIRKNNEVLLNSVEVVNDESHVDDSQILLSISGGRNIYLDVFIERAYLEGLTFVEFSDTIASLIIEAILEMNPVNIYSSNNNDSDLSDMDILEAINNIDAVKDSLLAAQDSVIA